MRKRYKLASSLLLLAVAVAMTACSDDFLKDKDPQGSVDNTIYDDYQGALSRIDNLYYENLPSATAGIDYNTPSCGTNDDHSMCTEEYGGKTTLVNGEIKLDASNVMDLFYLNMKKESPYGHIRECNDIIEGIKNGALEQEQKEELLGQAYFWRAWRYYRLVTIYGGVPLLKQVQNAIVGDNPDDLRLVVPRSSLKECVEFVCNDLDTAASYLPVRWDDNKYSRITSGAALALKGRMLLFYASPLFNRSDDAGRWKKAYEANKAAYDKLVEGGCGLAYMGDPGTNASNWAKMFAEPRKNSEAVIVTLYNNLTNDLGKNNEWEGLIRPTNTGNIQNKDGGLAATAEMVDLFPMADGKKPGAGYDKLCFFKDRDPRFYRTFAFPGVKWPFSGSPAGDYPYESGEDYAVWNYAWYRNDANKNDAEKRGYAADKLGSNNVVTGIFVRKRTADADARFEGAYYFGLSTAPYMEMRFAEVVLNLAESACGAGQGAEAVSLLKQIRQRVGYDPDNCGIDNTLAGDRAALFSAILYERQIELAYEGKRFDDMRRWMLWDGGQGQETIKDTWRLSGFGGNTCKYLGVEPFNGSRRHGIEVVVNALAEESDDKDPLKDKRPEALDLSADNTTFAGQVSKLSAFYKQNFTRKNLDGIEGDNTFSVQFAPKCYIIGFKSNALTNNSRMEQTIGWEDSRNGNAPGTFDPLADTAN